MKFYIGSGMKNCELVNYYSKILKEKGWEQTYDWVKNVSDDVSIDDMIGYAKLEKQAIVSSDVVIILLPAGRGAHIELGMALALGKKLFLCSTTKEEFSIENTVAFYELPNVVKLVGHNFEQVYLGIDHLSYRIEDVESIEIKIAKETINFIEYKGKSFIQRIRRAFINE